MPSFRLLPVLACVLLVACKEGDVGGFDGSLFDDAGTQGGKKDAGKQSGEDSGQSGEDSGTTSHTDGGGSGAITVADVPNTLAQALCGAMSACRGAGLLADYLGGEDCETLFTNRQTDGQLRLLQDSVDDGRVVFDASAAGKCADDYVSLACDALTKRLPASCKDMIKGTVKLAGACEIDVDCAGDAFCDRGDDGETCPGSCKPLLAKDSVCRGTRECADGLSCSKDTPRTCIEPGKDGDDCSLGEWQCDLGFMCHKETAGKVCRALGAVYTGKLGDDCTMSGTYCSDGMVCASETASMGKCEAVVGKGEACKRAAPNQCPREQYCDAVNPGDTGKCVDFPSAGDPCLTGRSQVCAAGHVCVVDTCEAVQTAGKSCGTDAECYSGTCLGDTGSAICVTPIMCQLPTGG
ncbi:MAG TPA: Dickkopf N-terminal cysteine-rich domain-containing protein [Polyangiales bacterium]|jgi:hypothetical protein|nr:Dickkopf N-terminal cysteine-rich domain-containing protein [Polyangiales bacterium]